MSIKKSDLLLVKMNQVENIPFVHNLYTKTDVEYGAIYPTLIFIVGINYFILFYCKLNVNWNPYLGGGIVDALLKKMEST